MYGRFLIFLLGFLFSLAALAVDETTIIADADIMEKNTPKRTLSLKGNVNVIFHQQHLLCDEAVVYEDKGLIVARGNVVLQNARTTLRGERIEFNYNTNTGTLYNGVVTSGQVLLQSDVIQKVGPDNYMANDAYYTACLTCPPSWGFTSSKVEAEIGGYAYINRPWLYILEVPVLPLPYLVVPLNSNRQTGFLVPSVGSNNNGGFSFEQPFFWAIDRSHDATFTAITYEKRGVQLHGNYRYKVSEESSGELNTSFMKDRVFGFQDRWFLQYQHHYELPDDYTQRVELAMASDTLFAEDFPRQLAYLGYAAFENNVSTSKRFDESLLTFEGNYNISLLESDFSLNLQNPDSLHRLPEIDYTLLDQKVSDDLNLYFSLNANYLNVTRQGLAFERTVSGSECSYTELDAAGNPLPNPVDLGVCYDTTNNPDGFNYGTPFGTTPVNERSYGDLIRTGQRFDIEPRLHAPFWVGDVLDVDPSVSFRYTQYALGVQSNPNQGFDAYPNRHYTRFGMATRSYFSGVFDWSEKTRIKHSIIPEIDLSYIPHIEQSDHNFFGNPNSLRYFRERQPIDNSDTDWRNGGRGIQFDNRDRVIGKQIVNFSVTNKILSRSKEKVGQTDNLNSVYDRNLYLRVSQAFDINDTRNGEDARPWQDINTDLYFNVGNFTQFVSTNYFPYHNRTEWQTGTRYTFWAGNYLQLQYNKQYIIPLDPPVNDDLRTEALVLSAGFKYKYIDFFGFVEYDLKVRGQTNPFTRWTVMANMIPPGDCWSVLLGVEQQLGSKVLNPIFSMEFRFSE